MVNCSRMMDEVRWIKTPEEIAQQKRAADLLDDVLAEIFPTIREGETEREVHARVLAACTRRGAGYVHGVLNSSSNEVMYGGESDVAFHRGDFVRNGLRRLLPGMSGTSIPACHSGKTNRRTAARLRANARNSSQDD